MIKKLFLIAFIFLNVKVSVATSSSIFQPAISNFRVEAFDADKVFFDSNVPITASSTTGFIISGKTITSVTINPNQLTGHYFTVSSPFTFWDNNTIRYEGGSDMQDINNNLLHKFTLEYIINKIPEPDASTYRYVTASAPGRGDGLTENTAWTINEAFSKAVSGMTIWLKAGDYGNKRLSFSSDGTSVSPIKFIGYKNTIGDITSNYYDYGVNFDANEMPTLTGNNPRTGVAIWLRGVNYVIFRNIQITKYQFGFRANTNGATGSNIIFDRFNGKTFGNDNQEFADAISFQTNGTFQGRRTFVGNDHLRILDSRFVNCTLAAYELFGDGFNLMDGNKSYNDRVSFDSRNDYHFSFNGDNNISRNCYIENFNTTRTNKSTHGIGIRGQNRLRNNYNLIEKSVGVNITEPFYIRNSGCEYNVIKDCEAKNNANVSNYFRNENSGAVWIWGGSNYNIIERVTASNTTFGIGFKDNGEEGSPDTTIGHDNIIRNSVFTNTKYAIYSQGTSSSKIGDLKDNKIINCTFDGNNYFFKQYYTNVKNLEVINCTISNVASILATSPLSDFTFTNCNFYNSWNVMSGTGNISADPKFEDPANSNFNLKPDSPLIDAGAFIMDVIDDHDKKMRPQGASHDIGAYEYPDSSTSSTNVNAGPDVSICQGEPTTLTATGDGDFLWSTGEITPSIEVTPDTTTTYTVTITNANLSESDDVIVTVETAPSVVLGDDITICSGEEVILTAEGTGNFLWSTGETTPTITVNPTTTTTYSVTASNSCATTATDDIVVNVNPGVNLNAGTDVTICLGDSITLTASSDGDFLWSTGETTASITVNPTETTTYTVTSTLGTCSLSDEVIVTVESTPTVTLGDDITICSGEEVVLTAQGTGNFLWSTGETTPSITVIPDSTTTYSVTASSCNTSVTDEIIVNVTPEIVLDAGNDVTICAGESVTLTATGSGNFLWSTGETTPSITVSPTVITSYTVTSSIGNCSLSDEVIVSVDEAPSVSLGDDITICYGETITLTAEGTGDFLWNTGEITSSIIVSPTSTTTYSVTANSSCSTGVTDEITVNVTPEIVLDAGEDITICQGDSVTLTATGNGNFLWSTGETTASITVNPSIITSYTVTSTLGNCSKSDEVIVTVESPPSVSLGDDITICYGESVTLIAGGVGNFLWSTGETTSSILVNPTSTTTYSVTDTSCNTSISDEITVTVNPQIMLDAGNDVTICQGTGTTLTATGNGNFLWSTGETTASITVNPNVETVYTVTSSSNGCEVSDEVTVSIEAAPEVNLNVDDTIIRCATDQEAITLMATGVGDFLWSTGETTPSITVNTTGTTRYTVTATNACGETATDEVLIIVNEPVIADAGEDVAIGLGQSTILTATGGDDYLWSTGETAQSIIVNPTEDTVYYVAVARDGCTDSDEVAVSVGEAVLMINTGLDITICKGDKVTLKASGSNDYLWSTGEITPIIYATPDVTTNYSVSAYVKGVLETAEITVFVEDCAADIASNSNNRINNHFEVYPNPTEGIVNIFLPDLTTKIRVSVISLNGSLLYNKEIKADNNGIFTQIDLSSMARGIYFIKMFNDNFNETKKILVM